MRVNRSRSEGRVNEISAPTPAAQSELCQPPHLSPLSDYALYQVRFRYHLPAHRLRLEQNKPQEPRVAIPTGTYRQTNLVSDLPA